MDHEALMEGSTSKIPRRDFLRDTAALAGAACLSPLFLSCQRVPGSPAKATATTAADAMDEALEMMAKLAPLSNHGPMAAEALVALGQRDAVVPFAAAYKKRFTRGYPSQREAITSQNWRAALGDGTRNADWSAFFDRELNETSWREVLQKWSGTLAPGLAAAAAHGLIRTGHAVRSLAVRESPLRRRELAEGLGYWAAYYQTLPEAATKPPTQLKPADAISRIPRLPDDLRARGSIMAGLQSLNGFAPFGSVANLVSGSGKPEEFLSELTETFAAVYLRYVSPRSFVTLLHAVTGLTAIRSLLPYVSPQSTQSLLHYGWQVGAGLYSVAGIDTRNPSPEDQAIEPAQLIARAVEINEEHAIKFTEACLREHALNTKPVYLQAARDLLGRISPVGTVE